MSSGGGAPAPERPTGPSSDAVRKSSPDLLRHVLEATLARDNAEISAAELEQLRDIARQHQTASLDMAQIAERLVASLLSSRFPDLASADAHRLMCSQIASSLCGDPTSMQRLKTLWNQLRQSVT